jgi:hypothetical protein
MSRLSYAEEVLADAKVEFAKIADHITDAALDHISTDMLRLGLDRGFDEEDRKLLRPFMAIIVATNLANMLSQDETLIADPVLRKRRQMEKRQLLARLRGQLTS